MFRMSAIFHLQLRLNAEILLKSHLRRLTEILQITSISHDLLVRERQKSINGMKK